MYRSKSVYVVVVTLLCVFAVLPSAHGQTAKEKPGQNKAFDLIEFINRFQIGMTYSQVQAALPKDAEQEAMAYLVTDEIFVLNADGPEGENWGVSFKFDTMNEAVRRPEQLVEIVFSASLSSRSDSFDSLVRKANQLFGKPVEVDSSQQQIQQAGWRISGGSVLKLEYSLIPGSVNDKDASVDFILTKSRRRKSASSLPTT